MLKFLKVFALAALVVMAFSFDAMADSGTKDDVFDIVVAKGLSLFKEIRTIVFVLGGFGLVALAVASIFGRPLWKWFGFLALGLVIVAVAGAIIEYFTEGDINSGSTEDTLTDTVAGS